MLTQARSERCRSPPAISILAAAASAASTPPFGVGRAFPCPEYWVWQQAHLKFPQAPGIIFDYAYYSAEMRVDRSGA